MEQTDPSTQAELTIEEHLAAQKTGFKLQAAGLVAILTVVALAALGLFGDGVLSRRTIDNEQFTVAYESFYRVNARTTIHMTVKESSASSITVSIPADYLRIFHLQSVVPAPAEMKSRDGNVHFVFPGSSDTHIAFHVSPEADAIGLTSSIWHINGQGVNVNQFIFP